MPASEVFSKYKAGKLRSGSKHGPPVKSHAQAVAIYLSEKRKGLQTGGVPPQPMSGLPSLSGGVPSEATQQSPAFQQSLRIPPAQLAMYQAMMNGPQMIRNGQMYYGGQYPGGGPHNAPNMANWKPWPQATQPAAQRQAGGAAFGRPIGSAPIMPPMPAAGLGAQQTAPGLGYQLTPPQGINYPQPEMAGLGALPGRQFGGNVGLGQQWMERQNMRNIMHEGMHTGPIISSVGGRTDHHAINVPSGSYVLPAAHVSALGQGITLNGMAILKSMFGPPMKMGHGMGLPKMGMKAPTLPKGMGPFSSAGGSRQSHTGRPVPIMAAGGEYVLSPAQVARVGRGNLDHGHAILDAWVKHTHKKLAKTAANLPPPAKT